MLLIVRQTGFYTFCKKCDCEFLIKNEQQMLYPYCPNCRPKAKIKDEPEIPKSSRFEFVGFNRHGIPILRGGN